ncbi:hypothetical protein HYT17_00600 [Candidatus Microgenomates bacterium]|nr:hypothetical protein [Candidatus Microgenomates bacterium]
MTVVERRTLVLPTEGRVPILTTGTDEWIPKVAEALVERGETALLQCGSGPYILAGGVFVGRTGPEIMQLINQQKKRPAGQLVAIGVPREEMSLWVEKPYQDTVHRIATALEGETFGIIAPASKKIPPWLTRRDPWHNINEKLLIWGDKSDTGPTARLYRYLRENLGLQPGEFFLICTSANAHGMGTNVHFAKAYQQLGNEEGLAYAVMDVAEETYQSGSPPIISALPIVLGKTELLVFNTRSGLQGHRAKVPELRARSKLGLLFYSMEALARSYLGLPLERAIHRRQPHKISP